MKRNNSKAIEAEAAFAGDVYRERAAINRKAQQALASGSRQINIRSGITQTCTRDAAIGIQRLKVTYIRMLLHPKPSGPISRGHC
jgi:hypothetical protein